MTVGPAPDHATLVARLGELVRRIGAQSVLISETVAAGFGLHPTDLEALDVIALQGPLTAGGLARATGLSSGAVTALIDRLERAGYVERIREAADRRQVTVRVRREAIAPIAAAYAPMQARMEALWSGFEARQLAAACDVLARSLDLAVACTDELRRTLPPRRQSRRGKRAG